MEDLTKALSKLTFGRNHSRKSKSSSYSNSSGEKRRKTMLKSARRKMNTVTIDIPRRQSTRYTMSKVKPYLEDGYRFARIILVKPVD